MQKVTTKFDLPTPTKFAEEIEDIVWDLDISYLDAVILYCERKGIEPEETKKLISKPLKEKIEVDAMNLNLLPKRGVLPI